MMNNNALLTLEKVNTIKSFPLVVNSTVENKNRMYAISFDLDIESLKQAYGEPYNNAYAEIRRALKDYKFTPQQGSLYFGDETVNAVSCVLAVQGLAKRYPWFAASVRDIRMLRIEESNDLLPVL